MVAVVQVEQITGTPAAPVYKWKGTTDTPKSGTRYQTSDQWDGSLTTYPIPIPTAANGISGSYWTTHLIAVTAAPSAYIKNLKYYQTWTSDPDADWTLKGSNFTTPAHGLLRPGLYIGISSSIANARLKTQGFLSSQYVQATGTEGVKGYYISDSTGSWTHTFYSSCRKNGGASCASGGMVSITNFNNQTNAYMVHSGNVVTASTGRSRCIVTQVLVGSGATQGDKTDKTATFVFTEV